MFWIVGVAGGLSFAQTSSVGAGWAYKLVEGSYLVDDCPICARPTIIEPMRGSFNLVLVEQNPLFSRYAVQDISFSAGYSNGPQYKVTGAGFLQIGGDVAVLQQITLQRYLNAGDTSKLCYLHT